MKADPDPGREGSIFLKAILRTIYFQGRFRGRLSGYDMNLDILNFYFLYQIYVKLTKK